MKFKAVFFGLLMSFSMLSGCTSQNCNYKTKNEQTYYVYNYGDNADKNHCKWIAKNSHAIAIDCNLDISNNCAEESISIQFDGKEPEKYCDKGKISITGRKYVTIIYDSQSNTKKGKFLCEIQTYNDYNDNNLDCSCGLQNPTKIVGGKETGINEYPMMAGLVDVPMRELYCGATIISNKHVLTAAHCVDKKNISTIAVVVGEHDVKTGKETNATRVYRTKYCTIHPNYKIISNTAFNDIAVCEIYGTIFFNAKVGPVCLPFQHHCDSFGGVFVYILGWGLTEFAGNKPDKLQGTNTSIISNLECKKSYSDINYSHICTRASKKDACQMDSGGPVLWKDPTTNYLLLIGIISSGIGCASDKPGINTRVGFYIDWIESVTPGARYCKVE